LRVWLRGSPFQLKVWEALLAIPEGDFASYAGVARRADAPRAFQAVGKAVGANPVAWIIPCHRVIRRVGELGEYHWGQTVKRAMAGFEAAAVSRDRAPAG
jgi:AraC family transcriptional regulator of adaptative response/methylated-DNA-[protein]-cysteine methyltransferase